MTGKVYLISPKGVWTEAKVVEVRLSGDRKPSVLALQRVGNNWKQLGCRLFFDNGKDDFAYDAFCEPLSPVEGGSTIKAEPIFGSENPLSENELANAPSHIRAILAAAKKLEE
ncbi:hypothetical protein [Limnoglobus roseus]|uniref:Uncharacterized protein n=1 Tax=Limnoglobus roseus TaxID=2598579 RepID=A0A5C1AH76_9BACT|nr:hypothetical protein [Limnoglobus roseus]QEL16464.1 hypothetical protein PX52LOC_03418 [Limnoglobus roseus]